MLDRRDWNKGVQPGQFSLAGQGVTLINVSATRIALRGTTPCAIVAVRARRANTGTIYFGGSTVTADEANTTGGLQLSPGDFLFVSETDVAHLFINGTAADGVSYAWWT